VKFWLCKDEIYREDKVILK